MSSMKTMTLRGRALVLAVVALSCMAFVMPAVAVGADPVQNLAALSVGYLGTPGAQILVVAGEVSADTPLPAVVELAVPAGSSVMWMGELSGGESQEADIASDYAKNRTENGYDIYRATITKFRRFQIEASIPDVFKAGSDGSMTGSVTYPSIHTVGQAVIGMSVPKGYAPTDAMTLTQLGPSSDGVVWGKTVDGVTPGTELSITLSYAPSGGSTTGGATTTSGNSGLWMSIALVVTVLIAGPLFYLTARRMGARG